MGIRLWRPRAHLGKICRRGRTYALAKPRCASCQAEAAKQAPGRECRRPAGQCRPPSDGGPHFIIFYLISHQRALSPPESLDCVIML